MTVIFVVTVVVRQGGQEGWFFFQVLHMFEN